MKQDPLFAEAWNNLASAYGSIGNHSKALDAYFKAIEIDESYGKAMWGAATALKNLGRKGEALTMLNNILALYDNTETKNFKKELVDAGVSPVALNKDLDTACKKQIAFLAKAYGIALSEAYTSINDVSLMYDGLFSEFYDYLIDYYNNDLSKAPTIIKNCSEFMLLGGMAGAKLWKLENSKIKTHSLAELLSKEKGFFAMDEYCCDYLGIIYEPDNGNMYTPITSELVKSALSIYENVIKQVNEAAPFKCLIQEIASCFFELGISIMNKRIENNDFTFNPPKPLTNRDKLAIRLRTMANDPSMVNEVRSEGAMCYSIKMPAKVVYKCSYCGNRISAYPQDQTIRYYESLRKLNFDCRMQIWCKDCCNKNGIEVSEYSDFEFIFYARLSPEEDYRMSSVGSYDLQVLYKFLKNENKFEAGFGRTYFVGESTKIIEKLLGIKI